SDRRPRAPGSYTAEAGARERFRPPAWEGVCSIVDHKPHPACAPAFSDALFACPERREPLVACWSAGLLPTAVSAGHFLLLVVPVPALVVPVPAPIASLAAARLHFLCVAVHSLGGQHATAAEAARSCVSTRAESPRTSDPISDRKSTRLNSSHLVISYAVFCLKKKKKI